MSEVQNEVAPKAFTLAEAITLNYPGRAITIPVTLTPVEINGVRSKLEPWATKLLVTLAQNLGKPMTTEQLTNKLYGHTASGKMVHAAVHAVREILGNGMIINMGHYGYQLKMPADAVHLTDEHFDIKVQFNEKRIEISTFQLRIDGKPVYFTRRQLQVLRLLASPPTHSWSKERLYDALYPDGKRRDPKILDVMICGIRKKFARVSPELRGLIVTVWGYGYAFGTVDLSVRSMSDTIERFKKLGLPPSGARWVPGRKEDLANLLATNRITREEIAEQYPDILPQDIDLWMERLKNQNYDSLKQSHIGASHQ